MTGTPPAPLISLLTAAVLLITCGCEGRLSVSEIAPAEIAPPLELTDERIAQIEEQLGQLAHVQSGGIELDEDDQHGHTVRVILLLSRKITYAAGRQLAEEALIIAQDALEPAGPTRSLQTASWHYDVAAVPADDPFDFRASATLPAGSSAITWGETGRVGA
ncbi:MAG: hypothetical protein ACF8TS_06560 [Maioricimonas sp. JB049]